MHIISPQINSRLKILQNKVTGHKAYIPRPELTSGSKVILKSLANVRRMSRTGSFHSSLGLVGDQRLACDTLSMTVEK